MRSRLLSTLSEILDPSIPLTGTSTLDYSTLGVHYSDARKLDGETEDYNPPHMDSDTLMILIRASEGSNGLEIANFESTDKLDTKVSD